jgi:hypothetical protein
MTHTNRIFSTDSPKAQKAEKFGYLNAIHYLAPATIAGVGDICPNRSAACTFLCLGWNSGRASMVKDLDVGTNATRESRIAKTRDFMRDRPAYLRRMVREIDRLIAKANAAGKKLCIRLNGSSDIAWEGIRLDGHTLFEMFPDVQFVDYTKNPRRFERGLPLNYHLTFSRSEANEAQALELLARGVNVAIVFASKDKPAMWNGFTVIDGDAHDLRHLDPRAYAANGLFRGFVVGLSPKGARAKKDSSGFVLRLAA